IDGNGNTSPVVETLFFDEPGEQSTTNLFIAVDHINVNCKPINVNRNSAVALIKETYPFTKQENDNVSDNTTQPIVRYSYQVGINTTLSGSDYTVTDDNFFFSDSLIGDSLFIHSPLSVAGYYKINDISNEHHTLTLDPGTAGQLPLSTFTDGYYEV